VTPILILRFHFQIAGNCQSTVWKNTLVWYWYWLGLDGLVLVGLVLVGLVLDGLVLDGLVWYWWVWYSLFVLAGLMLVV
jgi:hypothetical protein